MSVTSTTSTGHFATFQTMTVVDSSDSARPRVVATVPVIRTMAALTTSRTPVSTVMPTRMGIVFHSGRPSGTSYDALAARMNALSYPDADHRANTSPTAAATPACCG